MTSTERYDCCGAVATYPWQHGRPAMHHAFCPTLKRPDDSPRPPYTLAPYGAPGHVCQRCETVDCKNHDDRRCPVCGGFEWVGSHVRCM